MSKNGPMMYAINTNEHLTIELPFVLNGSGIIQGDLKQFEYKIKIHSLVAFLYEICDRGIISFYCKRTFLLLLLVLVLHQFAFFNFKLFQAFFLNFS